MTTSGVPVQYASPYLLSPAEDTAFHASQFPLATPGMSVRAAAFVVFLVRTTTLIKAYRFGSTRSHIRKEFRVLLKAIRSKHCPYVSLSELDAIAWSMFKRRREGTVRVVDSETGVKRDLVWVYHQPTLPPSGTETKEQNRHRRTTRPGEPMGMWFDITYAPTQPPTSHSIFTEDAGYKKLVKEYKKLRISSKASSGHKPHIPRTCGSCAKVDSSALKFLRCPCSHTSYCSRSCQKKDWKGHKRRFHA